MTKAGLPRPIVFPKRRTLSPLVVRSNMETLGITRVELERLLDEI